MRRTDPYPQPFPHKRWRKGAFAHIVLALIVVAAQATPRIVGYYPSWAVYARDYHVPDIAAGRLTHINYAFANISNGEIVLGDSYADVDRFYEGDCWNPGCLRGSFHRLQILKQLHPQVKTLISVGGWTWSTYFSDVALDAQARFTFARSCAAFVDSFQFDGVDLDWEYPVEGGLEGTHHRPEDRENFTLLLAEMRRQLDSLEILNGQDYLLTIAATANPAFMENLELPQMADYLDWINVMSYDFHGPWNPGNDITHFNSPLYVADEDGLPEPVHSQWNVAAAIQNYLATGVPRAKFDAGLAFYGRGFGGVLNQNNGLFVTYDRVPNVGTWENGVFDHWDMAANYENQNGYTCYWHDGVKCPWVYNPSAHVMIGYDDSLSIAFKAQYVLDQNLGGAMFWELAADRDSVLLRSLEHAFAVPPITDVCCYRQDGEIRLRWTPPAAYALYTVYASSRPDFLPADSLQIGQCSDSFFVDPLGSDTRRFYRVVGQP